VPAAIRGRWQRRQLLALAILLTLAMPLRPAFAWDSAVHRMITRLAVGALKPGPLKESFAGNLATLEHRSVEPDLLRAAGDKAAGRRHYIDLEYYGSEPIAALNPSESAMIQRFGARTLMKSGTLPWTIESESEALAGAWRDGDCAAVLRHAGYLSHYVADASQPLHTTVHFDGYAQDRGMHLRLERAADTYVAELEREAAPQVRVEDLDSVWKPVLAELRVSNALVPRVIAADRSARSAARSRRQVGRMLMQDERGWIVNQVALAASVLASIWQFEWQRAGHPSSCAHA
jgi:Zinc dependent phospholipase C